MIVRTPARWISDKNPPPPPPPILDDNGDPVEEFRWALTSAGFKPDKHEAYDEVDEDVDDVTMGPEPDAAIKAKLNAEPESQALQLHRMLLKQSLSYFFSEMLVGPTEYGGVIMVPPLHQEWCELIEDHQRLCILAPRDHGKSFVCSAAYALWRAYTNPGCQVWIFSKTQDQAQRLLQDVKDQLETSPHLEALIPQGVRGWNAKRVILANGSRIFARGFGTRVRGAHPEYVVCDDPLNDESGWSKTQRTRQIEYFFSAITNLVRPGGQLIVVGTPFHELDLYGEIKRRGAYEFRRYSALIDEGTPNERALFPERHSVAILKYKKWEMGEILFARELQCVAVSDDISLFPRALVESARNANFHLGLPRQWWIDRQCTIFGAVDVATGATASADYFVIMVIAVDQAGHRWLVEIYRAHKLSFAQMRAAMNKMASSYLPETLFVESVAAQDLLRQAAAEALPCRVVAFHTNADKHRLESGLPSVRVLYEQGRIHIPFADARSETVARLLEDELHGFTIQDGSVVSVTEHDDTAMTLWLGEQACRYGHGFSFDDSNSKVTKAIADPLAPNTPQPAPPAMPSAKAPVMKAPPSMPDSILNSPELTEAAIDPSTGLPFAGAAGNSVLHPVTVLSHLGMGLGNVGGWWNG